MNIDQVIQSIKDNLLATGSSLAKFPKYSNLYALIRSISQVVTSQQELLSETSKNFYINTSSGTNLDQKLNDLGIERLKGSFATGWCIVNSQSDTLIPAGTVLRDSSSTVEFVITRDLLTSSNQSSTQIKSRIIGSNNNLEAGTPLYSSIFPNTSFVIGKYKDPLTNLPQQSISGGLDSEDDVSYRIRAISSLFNTGSSNNSAIHNAAASVLGIERFYLVEHSPVTGIFTIFTESQDQSTLDKLNKVVQDTKPLGTAFLIRTIVKQPLDIAVSFKLLKQADINKVLDQSRASVFSYFNKLSIGEEVQAVNIERELSKISAVSTVSLTLGINSYSFSPSSNALPTVGNLNFNVSTL